MFLCPQDIRVDTRYSFIYHVIEAVVKQSQRLLLLLPEGVCLLLPLEAGFALH